MRRTPRLLPVLIAAGGLLFGAKIVDLVLAFGIVPAALAQATGAAPGAAAAPSPVAAPSPAARPAAVPTAGATAQPLPSDPNLFTPQEVKVLESLARRRAQLDARAGEVGEQAALLQAAERRIDDKIARLQDMQKTIDTSFKKEDQLDETKLKSLVKIYETMKPTDAARIFEQLDLPVLLDVLQRMKERKTAPILAAMDPAKAKAVTMALAAQQSPQESRQQN